MERVSRIWNMTMRTFFFTKYLIMLVKKTINTKRWERHDLDETWGDHSMAWWQEGTEGRITKYIALGLKPSLKDVTPKGDFLDKHILNDVCVVGHQPGAVRRAHWLHSHGQDCRVPSCHRYQDGPRRGDSEGGVKHVLPHNIINIIIYQAGMVLPFSQDIYKPILTRLKAEGISAIEKSTFLS